MKTVRFIFKCWGNFLNKFFFPVKVIGIENVPKTGGVILVSNHISWFDPQIIYHFSPRNIRPITARWLFKIWWLGWAFRATECIPTGNSSKEVISAINKGDTILIFPEGGCNPRGSVLLS